MKNKAKEPRINMKPPEDQYRRWEDAAQRERRDIYDWLRNILDIVADSGLKVTDLDELVRNHISQTKGRK